MSKDKALNLIKTLSHEEASLRGQEFLAPLVHNSRARLRLRGLVYEFTVSNAQPGWAVCRVVDAKQAAYVEEALPWQRGDYLAYWPPLRLVLLEPLRHSAWLAVPYNPSDAVQRFNLVGPVVVQLVEQGQPFERVVGRVEGNTLWYDEPDRRADPAIAEALREALAAERENPGVPNLGAGEQAAYTLRYNQVAASRASAESAAEAARVAAAANHTEWQLRHALEVGGARLLGYTITNYGIQVTWERDGQRSVTTVGDDLTVVAAGVCLSGQERRFDLSSIVGVVRDSPAFARYEPEWEEE